MKPTRIRHIPRELVPSIRERLASHGVVGSNGCILWTGAIDRSGYGKFPITIDGTRRMTGAHRAAWMAHRGDIQGDLVVDHLCRVRSCVNVDHMELVTGSVNTIRGDHSSKRGRSGRKRPGEPYACGRHGRLDGYEKDMGEGRRRWVCRTCAGERRARYRDRMMDR